MYEYNRRFFYFCVSVQNHPIVLSSAHVFIITNATQYKIISVTFFGKHFKNKKFRNPF